MTGGIYRSKFEAMKAPHIMRRRVHMRAMEKQGAIEEALHESLLEKTNFWQNVLERLVNVTLMLAKCNLLSRGSSEELSKDKKGNFLSIIQLLAKYDTVLDKLLQISKSSPKYLSPLIPNKLISVLAEEVLRNIKSKLQSAHFSIILDTTQDVNKKDQLSEIRRNRLSR